MRFVKTILMLGAAACWQASAQVPSWDSSGNGLLNGTYYFREVIYQVADSTGDLSRAVATYGTITFNGAGGYSIPNATVVDSSASSLQTLTTTGSYTTGASGYTFFTVPNSITGTGTVHGLVANGIFVGSTTENGFNDLFIAAPIGAQAGNSAFQGSYTASAFFPSGTPSGAADATFQLGPDGAGNLGTVNINGYYGGGGTTQITQSSSNVKYSFVNGAGVITFPTSSTANFYSGQEYMYISADRNFIFGGAPQSFDMFVGVKNNASGVTPNFNGIYYEAGLDEDTSTLASSGFAAFDTFYGSYNVNGGNIVGHERLFTPLFDSTAEGFTYATTYPTPFTGNSYTDPTGETQYTFGNGGAIRIGFGIGPTMAINVGLQAPTLTSPGGVFLNPMGVTNAASFAPFTAGLSPGEFIVLYGSNLAPSTKVATSLPFPQSLNGVSVTVDGLPVPIYYVSSSQISIIVPYAASFYSVANIVVTNNGVVSNTISQPMNLTTPGIFTQTANGLGYGAIEHAINGQVVTASNPAAPGETVSVFLSGLGSVFPPVTEGTAGPTNPLSTTTNTLIAYVDGTAATITYSGLAPSLAGLYQMNVTIPSTAVSGSNSLEIVGPDSDNFEAQIPVGTGTSAAAERPATDSVMRVRPHRNARPIAPVCTSVLCSH